jgi:hypothetical protein
MNGSELYPDHQRKIKYGSHGSVTAPIALHTMAKRTVHPALSIACLPRRQTFQAVICTSD